MKDTPIPPQLAHLRVSKRGYVIPYFVSMRDGQPDFVNMDVRKQQECIERHLCSICGKKLYSDYAYYVSGPMGYQNRASSDPAMHRVCAEYALAVCPHMLIQKARRRELEGGREFLNEGVALPDKPEYILLVKAHAKFKVIELPKGGLVIRYNPVGAEKYVYVDGLLQKATNG